MTCNRYQAMITPFIKGELGDREKEDFLGHVGGCADCREELEVYFILLTSMKQLDDDKELSNDFHKELVNLLKRSGQEIEFHKRAKVRRRVIFSAMVAAVVILFGFSFGNNEIETDTSANGSPVAEDAASHYELRFRFFDERHCYFDRVVPESIKFY